MEDGKTQNQAVTSVGNAWITCRSKSHNGRIYYFNTVSGEAAWNLSETEIEKAKSRTKSLENQDVVFGCPEPKDPPGDGPSNVPPKSCQMFMTPTVYNKQIINNKFPTQTCYSSNPNIQYALTQLNPEVWKMPDVPSLNTVWEVPPSHQIFIAPSVTQGLNEATIVNVGSMHQQNSPIQTSLSKRFSENNNGHNATFTSGITKHYNNYNHRYQNQRAQSYNKRRFQNNANNTVSNDLRHKISAKRSMYKNYNKKAENHINEDPETYESDIIDEKQHTTLGNPIEKVTCTDGFTSQKKLDLKPLRELARPEVKLDCWYIVTDSSVLLNNLNYLGTVIESDEDCCLMVPQYVMTKLQALAFSSERIKFRARNAIRLLTQQFDAGSAFITSEESSQSETDECTSVFNSCLYLTKGNNYLVLLSNNIDMLKYKYTTEIPIFTITELKSLLRNPPIEQCNDINLKPNHDRHIKITVTNDVKRNVAVEVDPEICAFDSSLIKFDDKETPDISDDSIGFKDLAGTLNCKVDAGVQTEYAPETTDTRLEVNNTLNDTAIKTNVTNCQYNNHELSDSTGKKRDIRLKRGLSNENPEDTGNINLAKKQFKWRRKRCASTTQTAETTANKVLLRSNTMEHQQTICRASPFIENTKLQNGPNLADVSVFKSTSNITESESSSSVKRYVFDKVIIDETSTSGIISNTGSVDSENSTPNNQQNLEEQSKEPEMRNVMFEITSSNMEEFLKMRCDEWVSRFVQIMEDVLTEILQQDPQFINHEWPPPWTIREATHCIGLKYSGDSDVVDAAFKLSNILKKVCDNRGAITADLKPSEYMEMYSYGVYMVDTLQDVRSCEDLQTASESLKKLLTDIQNVNTDCSQHEAFVDCIPKNRNVATEPEQCSANDTIEQENTPQKPEKLINTTNYNLRSSKKKIQDQEAQKQEVKFIRNIDIQYSFFDSLKLQKKSFDTTDSNEKVTECVSTKSVPIETQNEFDDYSLDYEEDYEYGDYDGEEYNSEEKYYYDQENEEFVQEDLLEPHDEHEYKPVVPPKVNDTSGDEKFKYFIGVFLNEIRETFEKVQILCEAYYDDIKEPHKLNSNEKREIHEKADKAQVLMENLCKSLNSILQRENDDPGNSIKKFLETAKVDDNMCAEYRKVITKCKDQAEVVLTSIQLINNSIKG